MGSSPTVAARVGVYVIGVLVMVSVMAGVREAVDVIVSLGGIVGDGTMEGVIEAVPVPVVDGSEVIALIGVGVSILGGKRKLAIPSIAKRAIRKIIKATVSLFQPSFLSSSGADCLLILLLPHC
jgi:hypothetical protein